MIRPLKYSFFILLVLVILGISFSESANIIEQRVLDIVHYLVVQKQYIFNDYKDPNSYTSWSESNTVDSNIAILVDSGATSTPKVVSGNPIVVNPPEIPEVKKVATPPVANKGQVATSVPILFFFPTSTTPTNVSETPQAPVIIDNSPILIYTNKERAKASLKPLYSNSILDKIAKLRLDDLFANQYFDHNSPDGKTADGLAKSEGYDYILIGENLAMGNFDGDQGIVDAWMASEGHRANILNDKYRELGVAERVDNFEGREVTIAVQIFGEPIAVCSKPSSDIKLFITSSTDSITKAQAQAKVMYDDLNSVKNSLNIDQSYYNQKVQEYNYFAKQINDAVLGLKNMIDLYNSQVSQYNSCISK
jgi:uncharacterized protein YkwD